VIDSDLGGGEDVQFISMETGEPVMTKMGPTARVVMVTPGGEQTDMAALPAVMASKPK
jgi:hypothetical protein